MRFPSTSEILSQMKRYSRWKINSLGKRITLHDADCHIYLTGKTGTGKSSLLEMWLYAQRWNTKKKKNASFIVLDPHGDLVEKMRRFDLAKLDRDRLVYFNPLLRSGYTPCINPFDVNEYDPHQLEVYTQQLVQVFQEMIPDAKLSNSMKAILTPCIATLLQLRTCGFKELQQFMMDDGNDWLIEAGKQSIFPSHRDFFKHDFLNPIYIRTKASILTKLQSLLNATAFSHVMAGKKTIHFDQLTRRGKIILCNLSKGKLGPEVSESLGRFIIARLKSIAFSRANLPHHSRTSMYLIIDEADTFLQGKSLEIILKETRKYGLSLFLCTQNLVSGIDQERLKRNLLNNTQIKIIGANGLSTLQPLAKESGIPFKILQMLRPHYFRIKNGFKTSKRLHLSHVLGSLSGVLLNRHQVRSLNDHMVKNTGYYKPILNQHVLVNERAKDLPQDLFEDFENRESPKAKFTL